MLRQRRWWPRWQGTDKSTVSEITPVWVDSIPKELEDGKLYINAPGRTLLHLCPCGCGERVTTSVHPEGWVMLFDGVHVTLEPSIGNPHQACRSHYFITENKVVWCEPLARTTG